jgi:DNA-binding CsgD family transcriptional regulator/sugar-specific transcriptional regulator TrmB
MPAGLAAGIVCSAMVEVPGLTPVAQAVYQAMLERPGSTAADLVAILGVPDDQVRAALDELTELTLLRPSTRQPGVLRPVDPQVGLALLLRQQEQDLATRAQELAANKAAAAKLMADYNRAVRASTGAGEYLTSPDAISARLEVLARNAADEFLLVLPGGAQPQASLDAWRPLHADTLARDLRVLVLLQDSVRGDLVTLGYARWLTERDGEVRTGVQIPPWMMIFDRRRAVVPSDPEDRAAGVMVTREHAVLAALYVIFQQSWDVAIPLGQDRAVDPSSGLTPMEKELLLLLAGGMTDESAAKRLGVSLRTIRRMMASLMERLDAASRFQAGLKAAQRGWLDP